MLTPADINKKRFATTRLREGYDQDEVDDFLDQVADQLAVLEQQYNAAQDRIRILESRPTEAPTTQLPLVTSASPAGSAEKILTLAQETADKHVADAKSQAAGIVADATTQAEGIKGQAVLEAQQIRTQGLADKQKALDDLEARHSQVTVAYNALKVEGEKIKAAIEQALQSYKNGVGA